MKKCVIVVNPKSGKLSNKKLIYNYEQLLKKNGYSTKIIYTKRPGHATDILRKLKRKDLVIIAGGDGTLNESIKGNLLREEKLTMAHLPFGTTNDVAHMYGLTPYPLLNLKLLLTGEAKKIDVCLMNEEPFIYIACMGAYVDIAYATPRKLKEKYGRLAYIIYGIKQLNQHFHFYNVNYKIGQKEYVGKFSFIFITNSNRVSGVNNIYPDMKLNDSKFEVLMCNIKNKWDIIKAIYFLKRREINNLPGFVYYKTDKIDLKFDKIPDTSWCIDGEEVKCDTNEFLVTVKKEIPMLIPKKNIKKLFDDLDDID